MATNYQKILQQARQNEPSTHPEEIVNLCVRVPKSWRTKVKAIAVSHDLSLEQLVTDAINRYLEQEGWD